MGITLHTLATLSIIRPAAAACGLGKDLLPFAVGLGSSAGAGSGGDAWGYHSLGWACWGGARIAAVGDDS